MKKFVLALLGILIPSIGLADGPPSNSERTAIVAAMAKVGCSGGRIEKDDGGFEVDNATCDGASNFDLDLNTSFEVVSKHKDD
jgi:hypothetical protein